jgi:hypothetical protein
MNASLVNLPDACAPAAWRQWIVTAAATGTPVNVTTLSISAITQAAGTATATAAAAHQLAVGDRVVIAGATPTGYNGTVEVLSVPSTTTFTYKVSAEIATAASGTLTAKALLAYRSARFIGNNAVRTANTGTVYLGLGSTNDTQPIAITTGATLSLEAATGAKLFLSDLWLDVATNADGVVIWWH